MRSLLLIFATLIGLVGALAVYTWLQPPAATKSSRPTMATTRQRPQTGETLRGIGEGENVWLKRYDDKTGELSSQFKGARYTPQKDGTVDVEKPEAEFFTSDGARRIRIEGASGNVLMELPPDDQKATLQPRGQGQMPSRGKLHDVVISVFEPVDAAEAALVATLNNAAFDTDTFRIATEGFSDEQGRTIAADEVPVVVRGRDYDFDGRGLIVRWNQRDEKLQLLEIAHGESLIIKNREALGGAGLFPSTQQATARREPEMLASADASFALAAAAPSARRRRPAATEPATVPAPAPQPPVVYRASFDRDVRIFDGDVLVATLDQLNIDMLEESRNEPAAEETRPQPTTAPAPRKRIPATTQAAAPTTDKAPLKITWSGKLRVTPIDPPSDAALAPGKPILRMVGAPAIIRQDTGEARCGELVFNSADSSALLLASEAVPRVTLDAQEAKITTTRLHYIETGRDTALATLTGKSSAQIPVDDEQTGEREMLNAEWAKEGKLHFVRAAGASTAVVTAAELSGDVAVAHPRMKMKSDALAMEFDPQPRAEKAHATTAPSSMSASLRVLVASGNVDCTFDADAEQRSMQADRLSVRPVQYAGSKDSGYIIEADGNVTTRDKTGQLKANKLNAELSPATQPAGDMQLVHLDATGDVRLSNDNAVATADRLQRSMIDGKAAYTLLGNPYAKVVSDTTTLTGSEIIVEPERNLARIVGRGTVDGINPQNERQKLHIAWTGEAKVDGNTDLIDIDRGVTVRSSEGDTTNTATANHLQAKLTARPTTAPAAPAKAQATNAGDEASMSFLADKEITAGTLTGDVKIASAQNAPDGSLLTGVDLQAETVTYDQVSGRMEVPGAGQMLYRNHRPPDSDQPRSNALASGRGATAFGWTKSLIYDEAKLEAALAGDVKVVHQPENNEDQPFNLNAQHLKATFERKAAPAGQAAPATAPGSDAMQGMQPRMVIASGDVHVTSTRFNVDANELSLDIEEEVLTATGDAQHPVTIFDNETGSTQTASEFWWNTKTDEIRIKDFAGRVRQ